MNGWQMVGVVFGGSAVLCGLVCWWDCRHDSNVDELEAELARLENTCRALIAAADFKDLQIRDLRRQLAIASRHPSVRDAKVIRFPDRAVRGTDGGAA